MNDDLISRKSVLDYIEKEISTARSTETISYLRALSIYINEYEPTAYDVDRVVEQLDELVKINMEVLGVRADYVNLAHVINKVKAGGIDEWVKTTVRTTKRTF